MIVLKVGGASLADAQKIRLLANLVLAHRNNGTALSLVLSAMGSVTAMLQAALVQAFSCAGVQLISSEDLQFAVQKESLKNIIEQIITFHNDIITGIGLKESIIDQELTTLQKVMEEIKQGNVSLVSKHLGEILAFGENASVKIVGAFLQQCGIKNIVFNGSNNGVVINESSIGKMVKRDVTMQNIKKLLDSLQSETVPIFAGFLSTNQYGEISNTGRNTSDYTAALVAEAVKAEELHILKEVPCIFSADPSIITTTRAIQGLGFMQAKEASLLGAKVIHPMAVDVCSKATPPITIKIVSYVGQDKTTNIASNHDESTSNSIIMSHKKNISLITVNADKKNAAQLVSMALKNALGDMFVDVEIITNGSLLGIAISEYHFPSVCLSEEVCTIIKSLGLAHKLQTNLASIGIVACEKYFSSGNNLRNLLNHCSLIFGNNEVLAISTSFKHKAESVSLFIMSFALQKGLTSLHNICGDGQISPTDVKDTNDLKIRLYKRYKNVSC